MISSKRFVALALFFPVFCLAVLAFYRSSIRLVGKEITLNITGYDPRDLLSGNYLIYTIDYQIPDLCSGNVSEEHPIFVCPEDRQSYMEPPSTCSLIIKGRCQSGRFIAGVERFYIPEEHAIHLEKLVLNKRGSVVLSVSRSGKAQVKELLIEGQSWHQFLKSQTSK